MYTHTCSCCSDALSAFGGGVSLWYHPLMLMRGLSALNTSCTLWKERPGGGSAGEHKCVLGMWVKGVSYRADHLHAVEGAAWGLCRGFCGLFALCVSGLWVKGVSCGLFPR